MSKHDQTRLSSVASGRDVVESNPFLVDLRRTLAEAEDPAEHPLRADDVDLLRLARVVGPQDNTRMHTILRGVGATDEELILRPQFSCITPATLRLIYQKHYYQFDQEALGVTELNDRILNYKREINQANQNIFVRLGEISVLGATNGQPGWRFVAATIVGEGRDLLAGEHMGLIDALLPAEAKKLRARERRNKPHISLLKTRSKNRADQLKMLVSKSEAKGMWAQLLEADTSETSVTARER